MPKVGEIDFKTGEEVAAETGQTAETTETAETKVEETQVTETKEETKVEETKVEETKVEEDINSLPQWAQDKLKKTESDKENYKAAVLKYKGKTLKTEETKEETVEETPEWDENSKKFQEQTLSQAEKRAEAKAQAVVEDVNEKAAIKQFIEKNPKLAEDNAWKEIVANYNPKNGKGTVDDVLRDLERALVLAQFENPNLATHSEEDKTKEVANQATVSKTTSKVVKESNGVSPEALRLAEKMRVDPKKLAEEDDSLTAEIKF